MIMLMIVSHLTQLYLPIVAAKLET